MANLIIITAIGKNGIEKPAFDIAINVSQIKTITEESKGVPLATSTIYLFDTKASGSTTDYQTDVDLNDLVDRANAALA